MSGDERSGKSTTLKGEKVDRAAVAICVFEKHHICLEKKDRRSDPVWLPSEIAICGCQRYRDL